MRAALALLASTCVLAAAGCGDDGTHVGTAETGQQLTVKSTRYQVSETKTATSLEGKYDSSSPKGIYVLVTLKVTNRGDQGRPFSARAANLITSDGKVHEPDPVGSGMIDRRKHLLGEGVRRGFPRSGILVFDVPPATLQGVRLRVRDLLSDAYGFIRVTP